MGSIDATGLPIGLFCDERFSVNKVQLSRGDTILLYTDGLSEAQDGSGAEYGAERLSTFLSEHDRLPPDELISACVADLKAFRSGAPKTDDLTLMVIRRAD